MASDPVPQPTLVLLPGLLCDRTVWEPQIAALSSRRMIQVADFWGQDSFDAMADGVLAHAPPRFALAGHSMGGRVALEIMRKAPGRVERLALLSTGVHPVLPSEAAQREELIRFAWEQGMTALARRWLPPVLHPDRRGDAELVGRLEAMWCRATPAIHEGQVRAALNRRDARDVLSTLTCPPLACPTLVLGGEDDPWSPPAQQAAIAEAIPQGRLAIIPRCGHMVTLEAPEATTALLADWLSR
ncbi:pimeloyl-ACP methyl ester carboxylesterase [Nitrospirillum amazonense]|uniref:Pimeloyl-ACP methyl ester carboxylesterase n=1 Tax=Nitrospirillum amazonense TaxID=28077 RepID=A0A560FNS4_9PROT|nr:alpha/beta fold hydrolase [Nitrospirillum amazonense]TWB23278.1 pimeloyl-ACP methyl ester carboxylesterase [Nitrospirillum amazonense]